MITVALLWSGLVGTVVTDGFQLPLHHHKASRLTPRRVSTEFSINHRHREVSTSLIILRQSQGGSETTKEEDDWEQADYAGPVPTSAENLLAKKFPEFFYILKQNEKVMSVIRNEAALQNGVTLFAPNAQAFENLGQKRLQQLEDDRNLETVQKIAAYHVIENEAVEAARLSTEDWSKGRPKGGGKPAFTVEGIQTMGGIVPVGRSKDAGLFGTGLFAKEDGGAVVGPNARILRSFLIKGNKCVVHEMDGLISPELLWRFMDQLRIPGF